MMAGGGERSGTSAAPELLIPASARGAGMGGGTVADAAGVEALYWNPAGVTLIEGTELSFSYMDYIADLKYSSFNAATHLGEWGTLGFAVRVLNIGDIIVTTVDAPMGTGEILSPNFVNIGTTFSRQLTDRVSFGATTTFIHESVKRENAKGIAFDFGFQYEPGFEGLRLGIVLKNLGPAMRFDGPDLESTVPIPGEDPTAADQQLRLTLASFELPTYVQFGASYDMNFNDRNAVLVHGAYRNHSFTNDDISGGIEYRYRESLFLRGGYTASSQDEFLYGPTLGFGLCARFGSTSFQFDYSHAQTEYFDNTQWVTLTLGF